MTCGSTRAPLLAKAARREGQHGRGDAGRRGGVARGEPARPSFFVANLYTVKGEIHEARAADADAASDKAKGVDERHAAIAAYDHSIKINEAIQKKLMEER